MGSVSETLNVTLADGTPCTVLFTAGGGVAVSKRDAPCGTIGDAELSEFAARRNGAMELAAQVEEMLGQQALTTSSQDALMDFAYRWFEKYF